MRLRSFGLGACVRVLVTWMGSRMTGMWWNVRGCEVVMMMVESQVGSWERGLLYVIEMMMMMGELGVLGRRGDMEELRYKGTSTPE